MKRTFFGLAVAAAVTLMAGRADASVLFFDDFESNVAGSNATPAGWTVTSGSVDIVGTGYFANLCTDLGGSPSPAHCIDMDGSTSSAGTMQTNAVFSFVPGPTYTFSFWYAGNDRGYPPDSLFASVGPLTVTGASLASTTPWTPYSFSFSVSSAMTTPILFSAGGGDNVGWLLDNASLTDNVTSTVPEPMSMTLLGSGLIGAALRRRRQNRKA